jgi:hypothetical protein
MEQEIWKPIPFCNGYFVSNYGRIKSKYRILKQRVDSKGYSTTRIKNNDGDVKNLQVHRIVASVFIPNLDNKPCVDHIDTDRTNNKVVFKKDGSIDYMETNLRWVTPKENANNPNSLRKLRNAQNNEDKKRKRIATRLANGGKTSPKEVFSYTKEGRFVMKFSSITEAAHVVGKTNATISVAIDSNSRTAAGYVWRSKMIEPPQ